MHRFFRELSVQIPLIQSPMAGAQNEELAIAVAESGGVGSIPCAASTPAEVHRAATRFQKATDGPLNLNFFCHKTVDRDPRREAMWLAELKKYYDELSIVPNYPETTHPRALDVDMIDVVCDIKPNIVSFHFGLPVSAHIERIRATGAKIIATATTLEEAKFLQEKGCDAVIAQGDEAGGHQGAFIPLKVITRSSTVDLVTEVSNALSIPVIAAGGVSNRAGIRNAMAAGASGVQIGTRFLKSNESKISPLHRRILNGDEDRETAITNVFTGRPARGFVNRLVHEIGPMNINAQTFPLAISALIPLRAATIGSEDFVSLWAGKNWKVGKTKPAADIVRELSEAFHPN